VIDTGDFEGLARRKREGSEKRLQKIGNEEKYLHLVRGGGRRERLHFRCGYELKGAYGESSKRQGQGVI